MANKTINFDESMAKLENIVNELESNDKSLDETIKLFEEGLKLVKQCDITLKSYEQKVNTLLNSDQEETTHE